MRQIKFVCNAVKWFDRVNGNTYHSVRIERMRDGKVLKSYPICYGYEDSYQQTAFELMLEHNWLPKKYTGKTNGMNKAHFYERENNYPIVWNVQNGLKREMKNNVN